MILEARGHKITFPRRPLVMAIINITDDSFCGDGTLDIRAALDQAARAMAEGADIIDIGAESARTNRGPITVDDEVSRLIPFIDAWPKLIDQNAAAARHPPPAAGRERQRPLHPTSARLAEKG